jgi:uncharacterized protein YjdB
MRTYGKLLAAALALSALPVLYACDGPVPPKALSVSPVYTKVYVGQMVQLCATTTDGRDPKVVYGEPVKWSSTDASVAEVSEDGWVKALTPGNTTIAAGCQGYCGSARIMVAATDPGSHEMDPPGGAR